jgi:hypothetical protein
MSCDTSPCRPSLAERQRSDLERRIVGDCCRRLERFGRFRNDSAAPPYRICLAISFAWLLVTETTYDTVLNIRGGVCERLMGQAGGVTWLALRFYVPVLIVSMVLIIWQLYARRGEALAANAQGNDRSRSVAMQRVS